jgi:hypothetical protein
MIATAISVSVSVGEFLGLCVVGLLSVSCVPPTYFPDSLDLSMARIGQHRTRIEYGLRVRSESAQDNDRIVVLYDYGPGTEGARRAAEASVFCLPPTSVGASLSCSIQRSLYGALAEASVADLRGSVLQVVYDADGYAEWVVFGSTVDELNKANEMIDRAEGGEAEAALLLGMSLSEGANGFPVDSVNAYKWLSISATSGATETVEEKGRIRDRLSPENRQRVDQEVSDWDSAD